MRGARKGNDDSIALFFVCAALWGICYLLRSGARDPGWVYPVICLAMIALQMGIIGIRFGYGAAGLAPVQPIVGVLLPPLIWLSFARPTGAAAGAVHLWPIGVLAMVLGGRACPARCLRGQRGAGLRGVTDMAGQTR